MSPILFCPGSSIDVDVNWERDTYLNIVADQVHPCMTMVFLGRHGLFQQDDAPTTLHTLFRNGLKKHDEEFLHGLQITRSKDL